MRLLLAALIAVACAAGACGGGGGDRRSPFQRHPRPALEAPVLLLAVDGFEWSAILPLLHEGRLPALESLIDRGTVGELKPLRPTLSPRLWATIATGKLPHVHGVEDFVREQDGKSWAYTSRDRRVKAFWNILGEYGVSCDVIGWWTTHPVEEIDGLMVAQVNTHEGGRNIEKGTVVEGVPDQVWPPAWNERVLATLRSVESEMPERLAAIFGESAVELDEEQRERWEQCRWAFRADAVYAAIALQRLDSGEASDVLALYLGGTDVVGHRFWAARFPEAAGLAADSAEVRAFGHVVSAYYRWVDELLGALLERLPREATVLVVSDHGMALHRDALEEGRLPEFTGIHFDAEPGAFVAAGTAIAPPPPGRAPARRIDERDLPLLGGIFDVCPTLLVVVGVPFGVDMFGRPMSTILDRDFLQAHRPQSLPTHDDEDWFRARSVPLAVEETDERLRQLRQLGYLEGAPPEGE